MDFRSPVFPPITLQRRLPINIKGEDKSLFDGLQATSVESIFEYSFVNVNVVSKGFVFRKLTLFRDLLLANDSEYPGAFNRRDLLRIHLFWKKESLPFEQVLLINNIYSHTYYHWLLECLPRLFLLRKEIKKSILLLPSDHSSSFHQESLKIFNVNKIQYLNERTSYSVKKLRTCSQIGRVANYHPQILMNTARFIKEAIGEDLNGPEKVYISRSKASRRKVVNENEVESALISKGFKSVSMEDFPFSQQVRFMSSCKHLVSIHGAGLANMIFMPQGGSVLELRKFDSGVNYFYYTLASASNLNYFYQFCQSTSENDSVQDADIIVDIEQLSRNLDKMLKE